MGEHIINTDEKSLSEAPSFIKSGHYCRILFDLSKLKFVKPDILVRIKSLIDLSLRLKLEVQIKQPNDRDTFNYAGRMGLFEGTKYTYPYNKGPEEKFFQLKNIINDRNEEVYYDCLRVLSHSNASTNYIRRLADAFVELADNIYYHSGEYENTGSGFIHAQAYEQFGYILIGLSDVGVGVLGSYSRTNQVRNRTEEVILKDVFNELESSLNPGPNLGHRGIGMYEVKNFIEINTGLLTLRTGNVIVYLHQNGIYLSRTTYKTEGTWISMRVPIR